MARVTHIDKAIAVLKAERAVLDLAIAKLEAQQSAKPKTPAVVRRMRRAAAEPAGDTGE